MTTECTDRLAACRADVISLRERLRLTAQILAEEIGASGPANADDLARIAAAEVARLRGLSKEYIRALAVIRAENDRYRAEVDRLTVANANYEINVSAMWADYKGAVADRERYRAALVEIAGNSATFNEFTRAEHEQIALDALAIRTESGPLSDDSGPISSDTLPLTTDIGSLPFNLCVRTINVLRGAGINRIENLVSMTAREVKLLDGVGPRVFDEIQSSIKAAGLRLKDGK